MAGRTKKVSPDHFFTDGVTTHYFPTAFDVRAAKFFLDKGANLLYALAVDYPGLYKIPLCYREAARKELKRIGFNTSRPKWRTSPVWFNDGATATRDDKPWVQLFFLGPKTYRSTFGTAKKDATSFKIWFGRVGDLF